MNIKRIIKQNCKDEIGQIAVLKESMPLKKRLILLASSIILDARSYQSSTINNCVRDK